MSAAKTSYKTVKLLSGARAVCSSSGLFRRYVGNTKTKVLQSVCGLLAAVRARYRTETLCVPEIGIPQPPLRVERNSLRDMQRGGIHEQHLDRGG